MTCKHYEACFSGSQCQPTCKMGKCDARASAPPAQAQGRAVAFASMSADLQDEVMKGLEDGSLAIMGAAPPTAQAVPSDAQIQRAIAQHLGFDWPHIPGAVERFHLLPLARAVLALATVQPAQPKADLGACNFCLAQAAEARAELAQYKAAFAGQPAAQQGSTDTGSTP